MNDRIVNIPLEHSSYPVRISTIQRFILNEIKRLSDATGYPGDQLPVRFLTSKETNGGKTIAEFVSERRGGVYVPTGFNFYLDEITKHSANQIIDTTRHEFAHYVRLMQYGHCSENNGHDALWKDICKHLSCKPERYFRPHVTQCFFGTYAQGVENEGR